MSDHYSTLGLSKTATPDEIKRAYRKLASQHHPDKSGGDTAMFQKIEEAYRILSDPQQRQQYDNPQPQWAGGGGHPGSFSFNFGGNPFDDIINQFHRQQQRRQNSYATTINITLEQIAKNETIALTLDSSTGPIPIQVQIPKAVEDGQQVRYDSGIPNSILVVTFRILAHSKFERRDLDLHMKYEISVWDLILGTTITVQDIYGTELSIDVAPNTKPNTTLRLVNRGLDRLDRKGSQFVLLSPVIPAIISDTLRSAIEQERSKY
jgi:DnaJ-class molecular chaperone